MVKKTIFVVFLLFLPLFSSSAATVILRSGKTIRGNILSQDARSIQIRTVKGTETLRKTLILKIIYQDISDAEAKGILKQEIAKKKQPETTVQQKTKPVGKEPEPEKEIIPTKSIPPMQIADRSRYDIVWRSAVLPGWGEFHAGNSKWGWINSSAFVSATLLSAYFYSEKQSAKHRYDSRSSIFRPSVAGYVLFTQLSANQFFTPYSFNYVRYIDDDTRNYRDYKQATERFNESLAGLAGIYLFNVIHSYFTGISYEKADLQSRFFLRGKIRRFGRQQNSTSGGVEVVYSVGYHFYF